MTKLQRTLWTTLLLTACQPAVAQGREPHEILFVRPVEGEYGSEDGSSYVSAFDGLESIAWSERDRLGHLDPGDTLYVCGQHSRQYLNLPVSGTPDAFVVISGDCPRDRGSIVNWKPVESWSSSASWTRDGPNTWFLSSKPVLIARIWMNGVEVTQAADIATLASNRPWWYDRSRKRLYVYAKENPATSFREIHGVPNQTNNHVIWCDSREFIKITRLQLIGGEAPVDILGCRNLLLANNWIGEKSFIGLRLKGVPGKLTRDVVVRENVLDAHLGFVAHAGASVISSEDGIQIGEGVSGSVISSNRLIDWGHTALEISNLGRLPVFHNVLKDNHIFFPNARYGRCFSTFGLTLGATTDNEFTENYCIGAWTRSQINGDHNRLIRNHFANVRHSPLNPGGYMGQGVTMEGYAKGVYSYNELVDNQFDGVDGACVWITANDGGQVSEGNRIIGNVFKNCARRPGALAANKFVVTIDDHRLVGKQVLDKNIYMSPSAATRPIYDRWRKLISADKFNTEDAGRSKPDASQRPTN